MDNIYMMDGSWTATTQSSGCGWVWKDSFGKIQLLGSRNLWRRETALHSELEALRWTMKNTLQNSPCQSFGTDCKDLNAMIKEPQVWPSFATKLLQDLFIRNFVTLVVLFQSGYPDRHKIE
uniref:RNase H type-1 domain-containing protein n=1 Tax=Brassica oleracea TaxID=3712 RepID=A0A3P6GTY1_BRAOL|nr:unnamed protein product [Brassica oleracea]